MVAKVIEASEIRVGTFILLDNVTHQVKKVDISKTGKHGHTKVRYEAVNVITGKKKVQVVPGHEKFEVPMILKRKAQILTISDGRANVMDSENFENYDLDIPEDLRDVLEENKEVEYWDIEGDKLLRRAL